MTRLSYAVCFLGGCSFLGFHFLPAWLMAALFFATPAAGPLLLLFAGLACIVRARRASEKLTAARLAGAVIVGCVLVLIPVAAFDFLFFATVPYIGPLILLVAVPFHVACVGTFGAGLYALAEAEGVARARPLAVAAVAGFLTAVVVTAVRYEIVPRSRGVFLRGFSGSGEALPASLSPLARNGQQDIQETLGYKPRSHHEPIAAIADDGLWLVRRSADASCPGHWIERWRFATRDSQWRLCLQTPGGGVTRNPTAMAVDRAGGVYIVGFDVQSGNESCWLDHYDASGIQHHSLAATTKVDRVYGAWLSPEGSVYVSGESGDISLPGTSGWLRKFDAGGREIVDGWNKRFPNAGKRRPTMAAVAVAGTSAGDVYVLLDLFDALSVRKFDSGGQELWQKDLPGHKDVGIAAGADGSLFASGTSGYPDRAWIGKVNADGTDAWEKMFALGHLSSALAVAFDRAQDIYVAGYGTEPDDKSSYWWIKKLGPDGRSERWQKTLSGPDHENAPFLLHVSADGNAYALGKGNGWQFSGSLLEKYWGY